MFKQLCWPLDKANPKAREAMRSILPKSSVSVNVGVEQV